MIFPNIILFFSFSHAGCKCPEGFKGQHCEIVAGLQFDKEAEKVKDSVFSTKTGTESNIMATKGEPLVVGSINENNVEQNTTKGSNTSMKFLGLGVGALIVIPLLIKIIWRRSKSNASKSQIESVPVSQPYRDSSAYRDDVSSPDEDDMVSVEDEDEDEDDEEESLQIV